MCYRQPVEIDLRGVRTACLSGDNGAGKSALLDCMTWSLWGKARTSHDDQLIALNASEMEVSFAFILNGQEFRVTRRRSKGGRGPLSLELQVRDGDRWRAISGATARETQRAIDRLLRMDYDTFINSSFILQGRADEFTTKTAGLRKQVLAEILNLSDYDLLEERARTELKARDLQIKEIDAGIGEIDERLQELPRQRDAVERLSQEVLRLGEAHDRAVEQLATVTQLVLALNATLEQRSALQDDVARLDRALGEQERQRQDLDGKIALYQTTLARRGEIGVQAARLGELRTRERVLGDALRARQELLSQQSRLKLVIQGAEKDVEAALQTIRAQMAEKECLVDGRPALVTKLDQIRRQTALLPVIKQEIEDAQREESVLKERRGELQAENKRLKEDMADLRTRMEQIGERDAICPICRRPLDEDERAEIRADYEAEGKRLAERYRANAGELKRIDAELSEHRAELTSLESQRTAIDNLCRTEVGLQLTLQQSDAAADELEALAARRADVSDRLASGAVAAAERELLAAVEVQLATLPYDREEHRRFQAELESLRDAEQALNELRVAEALMPELSSALERLVDDIERGRAELEQKRRRCEELGTQLGQFEERKRQQADLEAERDRIDRARAEANTELGRAQQSLEDCLALQDQREDLVRRRLRLVDEKAIYDELTIAFGKRGIQAMVIENIVPELQDEANAILDRMPGNTMRVEFVTQRQAKARDGMIETLDIIIGDEAGRRPYELYSGGEAFRVNFAIRVALSTLLARRAGARLQTLVIDEGFGTQDNRGRDGLIEAIRAIERDFEMILVITHIAELKEVFPTRIEVVKTTDGSLVQVH